MASTLWEQFLDWIYNTFTKPITDYFTELQRTNAPQYAMRMLSRGQTWEDVLKLYPDLKREDVPTPPNVAEAAFKALIDGSQALTKAGLEASQTLQTALQPTIETLGHIITDPLTKYITDEIQKTPPSKSRITYQQAQTAGVSLVGASAAAVGIAHLGGQLLDATHPLKEWGFSRLVGQVAQVAGVSVPAGFVLSPYFRSWVTEPIVRYNREAYEETDLAKVVFDELLLRRFISVDEWHGWVKKLGYPTDQRTLAQKLISTEIPLRTLKMIHKLDPYSVDELRTLIGRLGYDQTQFPKLMKYVQDAATTQEKVLSIGYWLEAFQKGMRGESIVRKKLEDFGYDSESIQLALDLHAVKALDDERGILDSEVKSALAKGVVTESRAREMWKALRYSDEAIEVKVQLATWQKDQTLRDASISTYKRIFTSGMMTEVDYRKKLTELGMSADGIEAEVASAILATTATIERLTKTEILNAYEKGITNLEFTEKRLRDMNIPEDDLRILLALNKPKVAA